MFEIEVSFPDFKGKTYRRIHIKEGRIECNYSDMSNNELKFIYDIVYAIE